MSTFGVPLTEAGFQSAIDQLEAWVIGSFDAAVEAMVAEGAEEAKAVMAEDVHDESDNPANKGLLKEAILDAPITREGKESYLVTVKGDRVTKPAVERDWGDRPHGFTPAPHDFTRNVEEEVSKTMVARFEEFKELL